MKHPGGIVLAFAVMSSLSARIVQAGDLTLEERVRAQEAIERVYYSHQIGATRPFEEAVPRPVLEKKVTTYLKQSVALATLWKTPVTPEMLRKEIERMVSQTRMPERLRELYAALGNDPLLIQECLARPALVDRLARDFFAYDAAIHAPKRLEAEALREELARGRLDPRSDHPLRSVSEVVRLDSVGGVADPVEHDRSPEGRHPKRLELQPETFDRYRDQLPSRVGEIGAVQEKRDALVIRVVLSRSENEVKVAAFVIPKLSWDMWWASVEGGLNESLVDVQASVDDWLPILQSDGSAVFSDPDCVTVDTWDNGSLANLLDARTFHTAVWTGSVMIVWGGVVDFDSTLNSGGRYNPATDTWIPTSTIGAPSSRLGHTAVWTGTLMVVWGGWDGSYLDTGGRYDPATDTWTPTTTTDAPSGRYLHSAVWTGTLMVVWGGTDNSSLFNTGGRYDPVTGTWAPTSTTNAPSGRLHHSAVWTGSVMIVWGGNDGTYLNTGGRYAPSTDTWTPISTGASAPMERSYHTAVWTGTFMIVWGGWNGSYLNTGGRYDPTIDTWTPTSTIDAPSNRLGHTAVWTGNLMVVWGGNDGSSLNTGSRYDLATDRWTPTSTTNAPSERNGHTAIWTGNLMIVWGAGLSAGGRYVVDPSVDDDGDGFSECQGDCDDSRSAIHPGAAEVCDGLDNDCDGTADGFATLCGIGQCARTGSCTAGVDSCVPGPPSAEVCDGFDNNCDGVADNVPPPVQSASVSMVVFGQTAVLGWGALADATGYDVVQGVLGVLSGTRGDFGAAIQGCLANDLGENALVLSDAPAPGTGFFYLVRGTNCGGPGTYDGEAGQVGTRDPEIGASPLACP